MTVDTQMSLLTYLWNLITTDPDIRIAMGRKIYLLHHTWAKPNATFPYMVHRIDIAPAEPFPMRQATYYLDIWSDSDDTDEILAIRALIIALLDELEPATDEIAGGRLWLQTEGFIPETEQGIFHYATQWNLRYYRVAETASIIGR